jgi:uncharacterized membrane protein YkvA (DUF1232 family)
MSNRNSKNVVPSNGGFFDSLSLHFRLVFRLLADRRVSPWLKLLPIFSLVYLFFPEPLIGPIDDGAVIVGAFALFIELCPNDVVEEHKQALKGMSADSDDSDDSDEDVVDAEYREIK